MNMDMRNSLSKNSLAQYKKYWKEFSRFYYDRYRRHIRFATAKHIQLFTTYLSNFKNLSVSSIRCYLSGIAFYTKLKYDHDHTKSYAMKLLLRAFGKRKHSTVNIRKPIGKTLMNSLCKNVLRSNMCTYYRYAYATMYYLMYSAALRIGELCQSGSTTHTIMFKQVKLSPPIIRLHLESFKHSNGEELNMEIKCNKFFCNIIGKYISLRGTHKGPLVCHKNQAPFTRLEFVRQLKRQLALLNHNETHYNTHSFRIGKATDMHTNGASNSQIETFGRWRSDAYKKYIKPTSLYS